MFPLIYTLRKKLSLGTRLRQLERRLTRPVIEVDGLIPELASIAPRVSRGSDLRFNLVVYSLSAEDRFGGIQTSLDLVEELASFGACLRILVTNRRPKAVDISGLGGLILVDAAEDSCAERQVQFIGGGRDFPVGSNDIFITHGWWESRRAQSWTAWQSETYRIKRLPLLMLIQEFEPGFYPLSSRQALAEETLRSAAPHVAIINTSLLADYYCSAGYSFQKTHVFEPRLHQGLAGKLEKLRDTPKERILFCYSRQKIDRNGFELVALALREWARIYPGADSWRIVSAGADHDPIRISADRTVRSVGKLSLEAYADLLGRGAVGLSLMISPHPSYPPLECAHFGLLVATNRFANKDISTWHDNLFSLDSLRPEEIAKTLVRLCEKTEQDPTVGWRGRSHMSGYLTMESPFAFAGELVQELRAMQARSHDEGSELEG